MPELKEAITVGDILSDLDRRILVGKSVLRQNDAFKFDPYFNASIRTMIELRALYRSEFFLSHVRHQ